MMHRPASTRHGYSIVECVIALPIMGIFLFMAVQLFYSCIAMVRFSARQSTLTVQRQSVIDRLDNDVQDSRSIQLIGRHLMVCRTPRGVVRWRIARNGTMRRQQWLKGRLNSQWQSDAVMRSAYFTLSARHLLRLSYLVHRRRTIVAAIPLAGLLTGSQR